MHKAAFIAKLHDAGGGASDVAGRGTPAGNTIGPVRQDRGGRCLCMVKAYFASVKKKAAEELNCQSRFNSKTVHV